MSRYQIYSKAAVDMGIWEGDTEAHALLAMLRDAGYGPDQVWLDGEDLFFAAEDYEKMCGRRDAWLIRQAHDELTT